jgi:hypothetical protein
MKKQKHPIDCENDKQMIEEGLRAPHLNIGPRQKMSDKERSDLINARNKWFSAMKAKYPGVSRKELSGKPKKYSQKFI